MPQIGLVSPSVCSPSFVMSLYLCFFFFFFFNETATTEIYTLSLHDALPISRRPDHLQARLDAGDPLGGPAGRCPQSAEIGDRKSTRLNSSHPSISYAVFCLKKKKKTDQPN